MAEQLKEFNFGRMRSRSGSSYLQYMEINPKTGVGDIWKLSSEDSPSGTADIRSMQTAIATIAKKEDLKVRTNVISENGTDYLVIQAYEPEEE
jgi:hypothetical protein